MDRRVYWALGTTGSYLFFLKWFPIELYSNYPVVVSFVGAFIFGFFLYQLLTDTFGRRGNVEKKSKSFVFFSLIAVPFLSIGIAMLLYFNFHIRQKDYLVDNGILIEGTVLEKEIFKLKGEKHYRLKVKYVDSFGKEFFEREEVEKKEFNLVEENGKIKIIYIENNPSIFDFVISNASFRQYEKAVKK